MKRNEYNRLRMGNILFTLNSCKKDKYKVIELLINYYNKKLDKTNKIDG